MVVDDAEVSGQKYVNILAGLMEEPEKTYLVNCKSLNGNPNNSNICTIVDDSLKKMNIAREKFLLLQWPKCYKTYTVLQNYAVSNKILLHLPNTFAGLPHTSIRKIVKISKNLYEMQNRS